HIGDKKAVEYLLNTVKHADERVRKEAIKALGELKSPLGLQTLRDCLSDPDPVIRKVSVKALGNIGSETAKRLILEKVSGKDFHDRGLDEKREFFEVLAHWNDAEVADFMLKALKKRSLFRRTKTDEFRACAAHALGLMGSKDALPSLVKLRDSKNRLLKEYIIAAIKKIEHGG
ncbi:MAG TPA: HEAT repeat domain-containing protein, partial [Thermodesulfovibrionales bacterium]|nr:HEAT repeat domain-containing protein [Thermodesulfovibrionales bacterium]